MLAAMSRIFGEVRPEISGPKGRLFQRIAEAARAWDGKDPVRTAPPPRAAG
jgi:hypothetical protein